MRRLEYIENLISRISEYCKTDENVIGKARTPATPTMPSTRTEEVGGLTSSTLGRTIMTEAGSTQSTTPISSSTATSTGTPSSYKVGTVSTTEGIAGESSGLPAREESTLPSTDYSLIFLNPSMQEAVLNKHSGHEVWYPPLNSFTAPGLRYRTCFIKIGTRNANNNLLIRVFSRNDDSTLLGIHEKSLTDGAACIEYRCSVKNPEFDFYKASDIDFHRYDTSFTLVKIIPVGQVCSVSSESRVLRHNEQINIGLSSPRTNVGNTIFEANIPDIECEGIIFHKSISFEGISDAQKIAIRVQHGSA